MKIVKYVFPIMLGLMLMPCLAAAETVRGKLGHVSLEEGVVEVDGVLYEVNSETTKVSFHGAMLSEEDLRQGDEVELIIEENNTGVGKRTLKAIVILRGSKSGLES